MRYIINTLIDEIIDIDLYWSLLECSQNLLNSNNVANKSVKSMINTLIDEIIDIDLP